VCPNDLFKLSPNEGEDLSIRNSYIWDVIRVMFLLDFLSRKGRLLTYQYLSTARQSTGELTIDDRTRATLLPIPKSLFRKSIS
jgi:hypothetical protein